MMYTEEQECRVVSYFLTLKKTVVHVDHGQPNIDNGHNCGQYCRSWLKVMVSHIDNGQIVVSR